MQYYAIGSVLQNYNLNRDIITVIFQYCGNLDIILSINEQNIKDCYRSIIIQFEEGFENIYYCFLCDRLIPVSAFNDHYESKSHITKLPEFSCILDWCTNTEKLEVLQDAAMCNLKINMNEFAENVVFMQFFDLC